MLNVVSLRIRFLVLYIFIWHRDTPQKPNLVLVSRYIRVCTVRVPTVCTVVNSTEQHSQFFFFCSCSSVLGCSQRAGGRTAGFWLGPKIKKRKSKK